MEHGRRLKLNNFIKKACRSVVFIEQRLSFSCRPHVEHFQGVLFPKVKQIVQHPFNIGLQTGTLCEKKFRYFLKQDLLYLDKYALAVSTLLRREEEGSLRHKLGGWFGRLVESERKVHHFYLGKENVNTQMNSALNAYTQFIASKVMYESFPVGLAAIAPCVWIYRELGRQASNSGVADKYAPWIATYSSEDFSARVECILDLLNEGAIRASGPVRTKMEQTMLEAADHELQFFNSVYDEYRPEVYTKTSSNCPIMRNFS